MAVRFRCSSCRESIRWNAAENPLPKFCPQCGVSMASDRDDDDIVTPFIRSSSRTKSVDKVYRDMEAGSETRANIAASMTDSTAAEMSGLKISDLRTSGRQGDVAAVPVPVNEVSKMIDANPTVFGNQQVNAYAGQVATGPFPRRGASFLQSFQNVNGGRGGRVV